MKNYGITEEQIKQLAKGNAKVKEWFPEVFKTILEVGKWYKTPETGSAIFFITEIKELNVYAYGFDYIGNWHDNSNFGEISRKEIPATDSEVLEALTDEAIKRGYKENNYKCLIVPQRTFDIEMNYFYNSYENTLGVGEKEGKRNIIFYQGKWAEIIKTYTKEEAEKLLNAKII